MRAYLFSVAWTSYRSPLPKVVMEWTRLGGVHLIHSDPEGKEIGRGGGELGGGENEG